MSGAGGSNNRIECSWYHSRALERTFYFTFPHPVAQGGPSILPSLFAVNEIGSNSCDKSWILLTHVNRVNAADEFTSTTQSTLYKYFCDTITSFETGGLRSLLAGFLHFYTALSSCQCGGILIRWSNIFTAFSSYDVYRQDEISLCWNVGEITGNYGTVFSGWEYFSGGIRALLERIFTACGRFIGTAS